MDGSFGEIRVRCLVDCSLKITSSLSKVVSVSIEDTLLLRTGNDEGRPEELALLVPVNATYSQISIYARVKNFNQAKEGL